MPMGTTIHQCKHCQLNFMIEDEDMAFYDKISPVFGGKKFSIPAPTRCPDCRQQRRMLFRNERKLYHRKCDATGKQILSIYSEDKSCKVYDQEQRWADKWDALEYGKAFDFSKTFTEQFKELLQVVPKLSMINNEAENSAFCNQTTGMKDSYLCFNAIYSENCYYNKGLGRCKKVVDSLKMYDCERCYEGIDCHSCHTCFFTSESTDCNFCYMCKDCIACENCLGCVGLRNAKYQIFNEKHTPESYQEKIAFWKKPENKVLLEQRFNDLIIKTPRKNTTITLSENCTGDYIHSSKNAHYCYDVVGCENVKFGSDLRATVTDSYDIYAIGDNIQNSYETSSCGINMNHGLFDANCRSNVHNVYYSDACVHGCNNCFGCVSLRGKEYCILNKQYTQSEYEALMPQIIEHMTKTGERGEFLDTGLSPFAYNESLAQEHFPLTKEEAINAGYQWKDEEDKNFTGTVYVPLAIELYDTDIVGKETAEKNIGELMNGILKCSVTGRPFRIIRQELDFYIDNHLAIPMKHPDVRHLERMKKRNPRKLRKRNCAKCNVEIQSSYAPERSEIVYCEACYNKAING